jgi:hypothetical protein
MFIVSFLDLLKSKNIKVFEMRKFACQTFRHVKHVETQELLRQYLKGNKNRSKKFNPLKLDEDQYDYVYSMHIFLHFKEKKTLLGLWHFKRKSFI